MKRQNFAIIILSLIIACHLSFLSFEPSHMQIPDLVVRKAEFWDLSEIYIDDDDPLENWVITAAIESWCSGSGTWNDPFIIENVTINGQNSGSCITIRESNTYFIIRNCTLYNSGSNMNVLDSGIKIKNSNNGKIFNNTCRDNNGYGISLEDANNCTVEQNIIKNNDFSGLFLYVDYDNVYCDNNTIINNNITNNNEYGIYMDGNHNPGVTDIKYNLISNNNISFNGLDGIRIRLSEYNTISNNRIYNNTANGINIRSVTSDTIYNQIIGNIIYNNTNYGIENNARFTEISGENLISENLYAILNRGDDAKIYDNSFLNNGLYGVVIESNSDNSLIYANNFTTNPINAYDYSTSTQWDNGVLGNYWSDYIGLDANDDGIGDTPYDVPPAGGSMDNYPIWYDGDDIAPNIIIDSPSMNDAFGPNAPTFDITINDASSINTTWYTIDGGITNYIFSGLTGTVNQTAWGNKGTEIINLRFYANDSLGYIGFKDVVIWKDLIAPKIAINSPTPNQLCGIAAPSFSLTIDEPNLHIKRYSLNGRPNITFTTESLISQSEWDNIGNGTVVITFNAIDKAGNVNSSQVVIRKDANIPDIIIISPIQDEVFGSTSPEFTISIIEENLVSTWYTLEGVAGTFSFTGLIETIDQGVWDGVPQGEVQITFYAEDGAGNIGSESVIVIKSIPTQPEIPGYNIYIFLLGIFSVTIILLVKKMKKF